jgi:phage regulator Rha-like protein
MKSKSLLIPYGLIENRIFVIRGHKVMLDFHLAELYGVEAKTLKRAVRRNIDRIPHDIMFELTNEEYDDLRRQFGTSRWGGRRYSPYSFTELGVAMLSSVLHGRRAVHVNIQIMRAFVKLREILSTHKEPAVKLKQLEIKDEKHDEEMQVIFEAIRQ